MSCASPLSEVSMGGNSGDRLDATGPSEENIGARVVVVLSGLTFGLSEIAFGLRRDGMLRRSRRVTGLVGVWVDDSEDEAPFRNLVCISEDVSLTGSGLRELDRKISVSLVLELSVASLMGLIILPGIPACSEEVPEKLVMSSSKCDWLSIGGSRGGVVSSRLRASMIRLCVVPLVD